MSTAASKLRTLKIIDQLSMKDSCDVTSNKIFQATLCHLSWQSALSLSFPFLLRSSTFLTESRALSCHHGSWVQLYPLAMPPPFASIAPVPLTCRWVQWSWCPRSGPHKSALRIVTKLLDRWVHVFTRSYRHLPLAETRKCMEMVDVTTHYEKDLLKPLNLLPGACSYSHTHRDSQRLMIEYVWPRHVNLKVIHPSIPNSFTCQQNTSQPSLVNTWPFAVLVELVKRPLDSCYLLPKESHKWEHHSEAGSMTSRLDS